MMLSQFKAVAATIVAVAASVLLVAPADAGKKAPQDAKAVTPSPNSIKLEPSAWIAKVAGLPGQWTYVVSPDPSGRHAVAHGTIDVGFSVAQLFGPVDATTPLLIDVKMTGPKTASFNSIWYGVKKPATPGMLTMELVYIGVNRGTLDFVSHDKIEGTHTIEYYALSADGDGDGLPDPGSVPVYSVPLTTVDTRLPSP
jgi:hypothetical protein